MRLYCILSFHSMLRFSLSISIQIRVQLGSSFQIDLFKDLDLKPYAILSKYQINMANQLLVYNTVCSVSRHKGIFFLT